MTILPILAGAVAYWVLGYLWYSVFFRTVWSAGLEARGIKLPDLSGAEMRMKMLFTFIANLGAAVAISWLLHRLWPHTMLGALRVGFIAGAGVATTALAMGHIWESRPREVLAVDASYQIVAAMLAAGIVYAFG